jgi:hypothetical protein
MSTKKSGTKTVYRDSRTGQWTPKANVKRHPETTETEHRPVRRLTGKHIKRK